MHRTSKRLLHSVSGVFAGIIILFSLTGCEWGDRTITLIRPNTDDLQVVYTDTVTIRRSTVMKDSILTTYTSGGTLLFGKRTDPFVGEIEAQAFALMQMESGFSLQDKAVYDSLVFVSSYAYSSGDTNQLHQLAVYPLTDDITRGDYYNTHASGYEPTAIGEWEFRARPNSSRKAFRMNLSDAFGKTLFDAAAANQLKSHEDLLNLFKGFALVSKNTSEAGFLGLNKDSTAIELHYHVDGPDGKTKYSNRLSVLKFYNRMVNDREGTAFSELVSSREGIPAAASRNTTVIQSGVGLMTRLEIPFLHNFRYDMGKILVNRAFLRINLPREPEDRYLPAPPALALYPTGRYNNWERSSREVAQAVLVNDIINNERYYQIDLTDYVVPSVGQGMEVGGFLLGPITSGVESYTNTLDRLILSGNNAVKLQLYYTTLNY